MVQLSAWLSEVAVWRRLYFQAVLSSAKFVRLFILFCIKVRFLLFIFRLGGDYSVITSVIKMALYDICFRILKSKNHAEILNLDNSTYKKLMLLIFEYSKFNVRKWLIPIIHINKQELYLYPRSKVARQRFWLFPLKRKAFSGWNIYPRIFL